MGMKIRKLLAFVLMSAMLLSDTAPAFAAEISDVTSLSGGVYTLDENGNFAETEDIDVVSEIELKKEAVEKDSTEKQKEETLKEDVSEIENEILEVTSENEKKNSELVSESGILKATSESAKDSAQEIMSGAKEVSVQEYNIEAVAEDNMVESQSEETSLFALFVENEGPQYFETLEGLKEYINTDENHENKVYNIEIRQSLQLTENLDFSDIAASEIRLNLCQNTITVSENAVIAANAVFEGNVVVPKESTLRCLPLYHKNQKETKLDCWNINFDFGNAAKLVLSDNDQEEAVYTHVFFSNNKFTNTENAVLELNGSIYLDGEEAYKRLLEQRTASFNEDEKLFFDEIHVNNDIAVPFVQENGDEWYENAFIGIPVSANHFVLNGNIQCFSVDVRESVSANGYSCLKYAAPSVLSNITVNTQNLEEHQKFELECERVLDKKGNLLSEGSLTLKGSLNEGNGRRLIFFNKFSNIISKHVESEENWWIEQNHNWENSGYAKEDTIATIVAAEENAPILDNSRYEMHTMQDGLGIEVSKTGTQNTYKLKVCKYQAWVDIYERIIPENGNGDLQFIGREGFSSLETANAYIKANESEQKEFHVILKEDLVIEESNKDILDYSDYKTYIQILLDGYKVTVNADMTICARHIGGSRWEDTEHGADNVKNSEIYVAKGKTLTFIPQDKEDERDHVSVDFLIFNFDESNLVLGSKEWKTNVHLGNVDFVSPIENLEINGFLYYDEPLIEGKGIEVTETLAVSNWEAEANLWVPVVVKNLELNGNISVSDFTSTGTVKTDNNNRFNIVADGQAKLNDIEVSVNPEDNYSRFIIAMDQNIELSKYREYTAEQWENIFANWEDELEVPEDIFEEVNRISERGKLTITGKVVTEENHIAPIQLEKFFGWEAVRAANPEEKSWFYQMTEFDKKSEIVAEVSENPVETFGLVYPDSCFIKEGNNLKTANSEVGLFREGTSWVIEYETFTDAVTAIDKRKDSEANYEIILNGNLGSENNRINLKLPKYANWVTITSNNNNRIFCKNAIAQTTNVKFSYVVLSSTANYDAKKYILELDSCAFSVNNLTAKTLNTIHSGMEAAGKVKIDNINLLHYEDVYNNSSITAYKTLTLNNITGKGDLEIHNAFTAKPWKKATSQMTLKGDVSKDVILDFRPLFYDTESRSYYDFLHPDGYYDGEVFGGQTQDLMLTGNETPPAFKKFMTAKNISSLDNILYYGMHQQDVWPMEYKGGIYFTNIPNALSVSVLKNTSGEWEAFGEYRNWNEMVKAIDNEKQEDWEYAITVSGNIGADRDTPLKNLTLPSKAKQISVSGNGMDCIITSGTKVTLKTNVVFKNILIAAVNKKGESVPLTINVGKHELILENMLREFGGEGAGFYYHSNMKLTGNKDSVVDVRYLVGHDSFTDMISQISKVGMVFLHSTHPNPKIEGSNYEYADYYIANGISGVGELVLDKGVNVNCGGKDFSAKVLTIGTNFVVNTREDMWSSLHAKNIAVSEMTVMRNANLKAGTNTIGDGKITLNDVIFLNYNNHIEGKVDKKGNSLINVKGNVTVENEEIPAGDSVVTISLCKKDNVDDWVTLTEGMTLLTAPKVSSSVFRPDYDIKMEADGKEDDGLPYNDVPVPNEERMGWEEWLLIQDGETIIDWAPKAGLYKAGNEIKWGTVREVSKDNYFQDTAEARLWLGTAGVSGNSWEETTHIDFMTFEEAVSAIDKMALQKTDETGNMVYETYTLELLNDIEIGNEKGDGKYKAIKLPAKASEVYIQGNGRNIKYTGNVKLRCNTTFDSFLLTALNNKTGNSMKSNISVGKYTLNNMGFGCGYVNEEDKFVDCTGKLTGSAKSGKIIINNGQWMDVESISGLKTIEFKGNGEDFMYGTYIDEEGNIHFVEDENGNKRIIHSILSVKKDVKVKEVVYAEYTSGNLQVGGNLTIDSVKVDGEVKAYIIRNPEKSMKVKGNAKTRDSVTFVPYKDAENKEVCSELKVRLLSDDGSNIVDGMKLMHGKYLDEKDWKVEVLREDGFKLFETGVKANETNTALYIVK